MGILNSIAHFADSSRRALSSIGKGLSDKYLNTNFLKRQHANDNPIAHKVAMANAAGVNPIYALGMNTGGSWDMGGSGSGDIMSLASLFAPSSSTQATRSTGQSDSIGAAQMELLTAQADKARADADYTRQLQFDSAYRLAWDRLNNQGGPRDLIPTQSVMAPVPLGSSGAGDQQKPAEWTHADFGSGSVYPSVDVAPGDFIFPPVLTGMRLMERGGRWVGSEYDKAKDWVSHMWQNATQ